VGSEPASVTGIVLAGGRSSRFGRDKLAEPYRGRPLLHHAILRLAEVCPELVVVVAPDAAPDLPEGPSVRVVRDTREGEGPLAGLYAGLLAIRTPWVLVAGGDMPELSLDVLRELVRSAGDEGAGAVALREGADVRPLPCVIRADRALDAAHTLLHAGRSSLRELLDALGSIPVEEHVWRGLDPQGTTLLDVDEPADLERRPRRPSHPGIRVGRVEVVPLCDGWSPLSLTDECPGRDVDWAQERGRFPWAFAGDDAWAWHVHAFVLRTPAGPVMVDTGTGAYPPYRPWGERRGVADEAEAAGVHPADVRHVVITHLHSDHAGGSITPTGEPRFPNARHHVHPADWEFFAASDDPDDYTSRRSMDGLVDLGVMDLEPGDREVAPGVGVVHTPGHTPGHRSVVLRDDGETLLVTGDLLHMPIQVTHPEWESSHDEDREEAASNRTRLLARARTGGWHVAIGHFARPFGRVRADGWLDA